MINHVATTFVYIVKKLHIELKYIYLAILLSVMIWKYIESFILLSLTTVMQKLESILKMVGWQEISQCKAA